MSLARGQAHLSVLRAIAAGHEKRAAIIDCLALVEITQQERARSIRLIDAALEHLMASGQIRKWGVGLYTLTDSGRMTYNSLGGAPR